MWPNPLEKPPSTSSPLDLSRPRGLPAAVRGHHLSWEGNNLLSHHRSIIWSLLCMHWRCLASQDPALPRVLCGPSGTSQSLHNFPEHPEQAVAEAPAAQRGEGWLQASQTALSAVPRDVWFFHNTRILSHGQPPHSLRSPSCWGTRQRSSYPEHGSVSRLPLRTLDPLPGLSGSEPAETGKLGNSSSGRAPEQTLLVYSLPQIYPDSSNLPKSPWPLTPASSAVTGCGKPQLWKCCIYSDATWETFVI